MWHSQVNERNFDYYSIRDFDRVNIDLLLEVACLHYDITLSLPPVYTSFYFHCYLFFNPLTAYIRVFSFY